MSTPSGIPPLVYPPQYTHLQYAHPSGISPPENPLRIPTLLVYPPHLPPVYHPLWHTPQKGPRPRNTTPKSDLGSGIPTTQKGPGTRHADPLEVIWDQACTPHEHFILTNRTKFGFSKSTDWLSYCISFIPDIWAFIWICASNVCTLLSVHMHSMLKFN